jgi:predicted nucleic acid-binding protein
VRAGPEPGRKLQGAGEPLDKERSRICRKACDYIRHNPQRQGMDTKLTQAPMPTRLGEPLLTSVATPPGPAVVLDTNVVLDWLLFNDPRSAPVAAAIVRRQVRWIALRAMRDELAAVLQRGLAVARGADASAVLAAWDTHAQPCDAPAQCAGPIRLRCSDPDDQMFLDLAHAAGARWLLSRDRAVLRLKRRAASLGFVIAKPEDWPDSVQKEGRPKPPFPANPPEGSVG